MNNSSSAMLRYDWEKQEALSLLERPLMDLLFDAQTVHRQNFNPNAIQPCELLSIKRVRAPKIVNTVLRAGIIKQR